MAGLVCPRALIFVLLVCTSHSYHINIDSGSSKGSGFDSGSGSSGSGVPVLPGGSGLGLQGVLAPSHPGVQGAPAPPYSAASVGSAGYYSTGAAVPNVGPAAANDASWRVAPQSPEGPSSDVSAAGGSFAPEDFSAGFYGPPPEFTPGELSHMETTFEHGSNDQESEHQGELPGPPTFPGLVPFDFPVGTGAFSVSHFPGPPGYPLPYWYPDYDWMFLSGQYPPGIVSHFSSSFEQGKDNWQDSHYNKYPYPVPQGPVVPTYPHPGQSGGQEQIGA